MNLLSRAYAEGTLEYWLCPREALEALLAARPEEAARELTTVLTTIDDVDSSTELDPSDAARQIRRRLDVNFSEPLEGNDWRAWFGWVEGRLAEVAADPGTVHPEVDQPVYYPWRLRRSRFTGATAKRQAVEEVLARAGDEVRSWVASPTPAPTRLRVVGEVAAEVGESAEMSWDPYDRFSTGVSSVVASRVVGVVLRAGAGDGGFEVLGADIADPGGEPSARAVRDGFPLLHAVLGGWFGDEQLREQHPWDAQRTMLETEDDEVLDAFAAQLRELLDGSDDEELELAVEALGCFVEPTHLRLWLTWMAWRIETFDWKPAV